MVDKNQRRFDMCATNKCCYKPRELKGKPEDCSPKLIKKCHGKEKGHPCVTPKKTK